MLKIEHLDHVALAVKDLKRSAQWYQEVLGLERRYQEAWGEVPTMLGAGKYVHRPLPNRDSRAEANAGL
jgi:catechol 2,3-dioxygenase-like lactoylglutathione lyase family enzyme